MSRMFARSAGSTSRRPTTAARAPSTIGALAGQARRGSARRCPGPPRAASRGCCRSGSSPRVFMSPWASNQMSPIFSPRSRWKRATPAIVPIAIEWSPPSTTGRAPAAQTPRHPVAQRLAGLADLLQVLEPRVAGLVRLADRDLEVARVLDVVAELAHALRGCRPRGTRTGPCRRRGGRRRGRAARR